jgi:hypothetical protein
VIKAREQREADEVRFQEILLAKRQVEQENVNKQQVINDKDQTIKVMTEKNLEMQQRINALDQLVAVKDDLAQKLDCANELIEKLHTAKEKM